MKTESFLHPLIKYGSKAKQKKCLVYRPELEKISARAGGFYFYFLFFSFQRSMNRPTKELLNKIADVQEFERQFFYFSFFSFSFFFFRPTNCLVRYPSHHTFGLKEMIMVGIIQMNPLHLKWRKYYRKWRQIRIVHQDIKIKLTYSY